jgi:AmmeMemoRadiSam system protein B
MPVPKLRPLDLVAGQWKGQRAVFARDQEGLLSSPVLLPMPVFVVAALLDGKREPVDVQVEFARATGGVILAQVDLARIIEELDAHLLLETPRLEERRRELQAAYRAAPFRSPAHAGTSYPADARDLAALLEGFLDAAPPPSAEARPARPAGLLAPHIDFHRGGRCYGRAYGWLGDIPPDACVVVLGVAHACPDAPFVATRKAYGTPAGVVEVDQALLDGVLSRYRYDMLAHEAVHGAEHSIEFQVLFLQHLARGRRFTILPILCSGFERWAGARSPAGVPEIESFVAALRAAIAAERRPVLVVAGVDLSHVGPRFGDANGAGAGLAAAAKVEDLAALAHVTAGDAEAWWHAVASAGNARRICGLSAIYTALRVLAPVRGRLLEYGQGADPAGGVVGFAACGLEAGASG